jgi:hypothetical protein
MAKKRAKRPGTADSVVEGQLNSCLGDIETHLSAHCLVLVGPMHYGIDGMVRDAIEWRVQHPPKRRRLVVIVETPGGYIEVVQRIVQVLRHHYAHVDFIVPNYAMSAGTVLVLSGDDIFMDYYAVLGPIDPQVETSSGQTVTALGYLEKYKEFVAKSQTNQLTTAELAYFVQRFDQAELYAYEQARELSVNLLIEWLAKYKFKNWKQTQTKRAKVNAAKRKERAKEIGDLLNKTDEWHSHGHGISMDVLRRKVKLQIEDLEDDEDLYRDVREYHGLLTHYMSRTAQMAAIHTNGRYHSVSRHG